MREFLSLFLLIACLAIAPVRAQGNLTDSDGDGLPDQWETHGVNVTVNDQSVFIDLPAMGANPKHKDLFVQVDYMVGEDHTHKPKPQALRALIASFARAPVPNPDQTNGITLHIDAGRDTVMDPVKGALWGDLSRAKALAHEDNLGAGTRNTGYVWDDFLAVKSKSFKPERAAIFRYAIFCHNLSSEMGSTSGWSRGIPGVDFVVSLGNWSGQTGTVMQQSGTFMHEFGHNLGLRHGGNVNTHRKPNYLSVMNYAFQNRGLRYNSQDGLLDYSRFQLPDLDENNLLESSGIYSPASANVSKGYGTWWRVRVNNVKKEFVTNDVNSAIDWNQNGVIDPQALVLDLSDDPDYGVLGSFNDWPALVYATGAIGSSTPRLLARAEEQTFDEEDKTQDEEFQDAYEPEVTLLDAVQPGGPGRAVQYSVTITNHGTMADTFNVTTSSSRGWADFRNLPAQVALSAGQSQTIAFQVLVPLLATPGQEENSMVEARSQGSPNFLDSTVAITSVPPPQGTAAALPGDGVNGGGCFIATAAYGSYLNPHVISLRDFRDQWLLTNAPGRAFVGLYCRLSPPLAIQIASSPSLRYLTLAALTPVVGVVEHPWATLALTLALAGFLWRRRRFALFRNSSGLCD